MDLKLAQFLLENLLERLDADAASERPQFASTVSHRERMALHAIVDRGRVPQEAAAATEESEVLATEGLSVRVDAPAIGASPVGPFEGDHEPSAARIPQPTVLNLDACGNACDRDMILCIDFGTAKSKAFAASVEYEEDPEPLMVELGLGKLDSDPNDVYSVSSSVWISDDGMLYAGARALSESASAEGPMRKRLDSIKQELSLNDFEHDLGKRLLEKEINPTGIAMSYEEALCFFLAYLTDLIGIELSRHGYSRYMKRRFTLPAWQATQRRWAGKLLWENLKRAQVLADTFSGKWSQGIRMEDFRLAWRDTAKYSSDLEYLMDGTVADSGGLTEPLAVGSSRVWADRNARNLMLVADVGAGTTDLSLFWVVQDVTSSARRAFPVSPSSYAIRMAGDLVDDILVKHILERVHGKPDEITRRRIEAGLRRRGIRSIKEQMFVRGAVEVPLVTDQIITLNSDEFCASVPVQMLKKEFRTAIDNFLSKADASWAKVPDVPLLVLTGGSAVTCPPFLYQG